MQESRPVSHLSRLFLLIGDQGVGLDFNKPSATYYVIFRDRERTVKFREQLSNRIAEEARGSALPEVDLAAEQEHIVSKETIGVVAGLRSNARFRSENSFRRV